MPPPLKPDKIDHDLEFGWLLCLVSRIQLSQRPRAMKIGGIQRLEEFPALTTSSSLGGNPRGHSVLDGKYRNHKDSTLKHCSLTEPWLSHGAVGLSKHISTSIYSLFLPNGSS